MRFCSAGIAAGATRTPVKIVCGAPASTAGGKTKLKNGCTDFAVLRADAADGCVQRHALDVEAQRVAQLDAADTSGLFQHRDLVGLRRSKRAPRPARAVRRRSSGRGRSGCIGSHGCSRRSSSLLPLALVGAVRLRVALRLGAVDRGQRRTHRRHEVRVHAQRGGKRPPAGPAGCRERRRWAHPADRTARSWRAGSARSRRCRRGRPARWRG